MLSDYSLGSHEMKRREPVCRTPDTTKPCTLPGGTASLAPTETHMPSSNDE